jgi:phage shock protein PspC (stress-responsive transcriptional regulator)
MMDEQRSARPPLRRDREQGMIAGVSIGVARTLGVDVTFVRLAFVLTTVFAGGFGLIAYLVAWISMPPIDPADRPTDEPTGGPWSQRTTTGDGRLSGRGGGFWLGVGLIAIGAFSLLNTLTGPLWTPRLGQLTGPLLLILVGVLVWRSSSDPATPTPAAGTTVPPSRPARRTFEAALEEFEEDIEEVGRRLEDWEERVESRRRSARAAEPPVGAITMGAALLTLGGLWFATELGVIAVPLTTALGATLLVIAAGLIAASFLGGGRGLIWPGLLITPVLLVALVLPGGSIPVGWSSDDGVVRFEAGEEVVRPASLAGLQAGIEQPVGELTVDLRDLDREELRTAGRSTLTVQLGVGDLRVQVPSDVTVEIVAAVGVGRLEVPGTSSGGLGLKVDDLVLTPVGADSDAATVLVIGVELGIGRLVVER